MANTDEDVKKPLPQRLQDQATQLVDATQSSRPGTRSSDRLNLPEGLHRQPSNRSYVIMNSVLYHLHPVKVKRHAVKVSYTLCLGGLSFFLFILLTVTGIFLMFFYRPTAAAPGTTSTRCRTA